MNTPKTRIGLLFGGPSDERNISAGSLKPWVTYLAAAPGIELAVVFFDRERRPWRLPERWYYTNTCEDFEAQLGADERLDEAAFAALVTGCDLVVPLVHGAFGEDGELQARLEELGVEYLFSRPTGLAASLDKERCYAVLGAAGLPIPRHLSVTHDAWRRDPEGCLRSLRDLPRSIPPRGSGPVAGHEAHAAIAAIKPRSAGSSLGVALVADDEAAVAGAFAESFRHDATALVEEVLVGTEFSVVVIEDDRGRPLALAPTEIETRARLYDTRSKYLQGEGARLHTPYRGPAATIAAIRRASERAFAALGLRDMARIDGFVVVAAQGDESAEQVLVTDVNGISGISFSSFVFLQTCLVGFSHGELVQRLVNRGLERGGRAPLAALAASAGTRRERVHVVLGGATSERQVSRQSGVFVGLSLVARGFDVRFVLMDTSSRFSEIGLFYALHHDVAEIEELVANPERRECIAAIARAIGRELGRTDSETLAHLDVGPTTDLAPAVQGADFVFLALHGGIGEDGTLQAALELLGKPYNGAGPASSELCSDKWASNRAVSAAGLGPGIAVPAQRRLPRAELAVWVGERDPEPWQRRFDALCDELGAAEARALVVKPRADGCSTGVKLVRSGRELRDYLTAIACLSSHYRPSGSARPIKLPMPPPAEWLLERGLIERDPPSLPGADWNARELAAWFAAKRYVELTGAVLERAPGELFCATPSLTVAAAAELSLEEKFQQGTGTNLPLDAFATEAQCASIRRRIGRLARALGITGYARLDVFWDKTDDVLHLIEANTLCGLTEATVFYTQMLAAAELSPAAALAAIVDAGRARSAGEPLLDAGSSTRAFEA